jgi:type VI protein secretion system component VasF
MDETDPEPLEQAPRGPLAQMSPARRASFWGFAALVVLAIAFYLWWGLSFGVWIDNGVYAVFITLFLFGLAGMWLMLPNPPAPAAPKP